MCFLASSINEIVFIVSVTGSLVLTGTFSALGFGISACLALNFACSAGLTAVPFSATIVCDLGSFLGGITTFSWLYQ